MATLAIKLSPVQATFPVRTSELIAFTALATQTWELITHISDEVEYLWRGRLNIIKALYFVARYIMLVMQIIAQILYHSHNNYAYPGIPDCMRVFIFKIFSSQLALTSLEVVLLIRVFALYNQSFRIKRVLVFVFIVSSGLELSGSVLLARYMKRAQRCEPPRREILGLLIFCVGLGFCQTSIFIMSLNKLVSGVVAFLLILALMGGIVVYELLTDVDFGASDAGFSWYLAVISIGTSRLILNMRKLAVKYHRRRQGLNTDEGDEELASHLSNIDASIYLTSFLE